MKVARPDEFEVLVVVRVVFVTWIVLPERGVPPGATVSTRRLRVPDSTVTVWVCVTVEGGKVVVVVTTVVEVLALAVEVETVVTVVVTVEVVGETIV